MTTTLTPAEALLPNQDAKRATFRITVDAYYDLARTGHLRADDRVELIEGEILYMSPIGSPHAECVDVLAKLLIRAAGDRARIRVQNPIRLDQHNEPQPDLVVARPRSYTNEHPAPDDIWLVIEVSDTTLRFDRETKVPLYARAGIREVWVVDLAGAAVLRFTRPSADGYERFERLKRGETVTNESNAAIDLAFPVAAIVNA
jgi:Uma2 family endonuclease